MGYKYHAYQVEVNEYGPRKAVTWKPMGHRTNDLLHDVGQETQSGVVSIKGIRTLNLSDNKSLLLHYVNTESIFFPCSVLI